MLLEIEELNGPRVLRYRFLPTADAGASQPADDDSHPPADADDRDAGNEDSRLADSKS
jgi:hypothetical protein